MNALRQRLVGFAACIAILGLLVGLPALLLQLGWGSLPTVSGPWWQVLTTPDDGRVALLILKAAAWITWLLLAASVVAEIIGAVRGIKAPHLPGLRWSQRPARRLVTAAMVLFVALPAVTVTSLANAAPLATAAPLHVDADVVSATTTDSSVPAASHAEASAALHAVTTHTVRPGDSLWSIAQQYLGSGERYRDISRLNADLLDGHDDFLIPGWVLTLPQDAETVTYTVQGGDTLAAIARTRLGDETRWPGVYEASRHTVQDGGRRLTDPDLILPGWTLTLPSGPAGAAPTSPSQNTTPDATADPSAVGAPAAASPAPAASTSTVPQATASAPATSAPAPTWVASSDATPELPTHQAPPSDGQLVQAPWLLVGLTGGGALLAGGVLTLLRRRRRAQLRARRPGRTLALPAPELVPVEKTLITSGSGTAPRLDFIDQALRRLADTMAEQGRPVPQLEAVQLLPCRLVIHLAEPVDLPEPWRASDDATEGRQWSLSDDDDPIEVHSRAPYPQLVTVGRDDDQSTWLVNLEQLGTVSLVGDPTYAGDFARYLAAEIVVNPWSSDVQLDCIGVASELADLDPARIRHHRVDDLVPDGALDAAGARQATAAKRGRPDPAVPAMRHANAIAERCASNQVDVTTGRPSDVGDELWGSHLVLIDAEIRTSGLDELMSFISEHPNGAGTAVMLVGDHEPIRGVGVRLTGEGRVQLPSLGLDLVAVGLTPDEAAGCALLLSQADQLDDSPVPVDGDEGWRGQCDAAGALRTDLVLPRDTDPEALDEPVTTVLEQPDREVLDEAAATPEDLRQLSPLVPAHVRERVEASDVTLDADVAAWFDPDCDRPRLSLLGPIHARVGPGGNPGAASKRRAFYAEVLTFLALNPLGVSTDQLITAFGGSPSDVRKHLTIVRAWLGADPATDQRYLPDAHESPAAKMRGTGVYQVLGVLVDLDLFRRLRVRGQARGAEGLADLQRALTLVEGEPFAGQRDGGWGWLADGVRIDQHILCGIVDVAHLVTMAALTSGDLQAARFATEVAMTAAPYEDTPQMDLAAIARAEGDHATAHRVLIDAVANRSEDGEAPADLAARTAEILRDPRWTKGKGQVA